MAASGTGLDGYASEAEAVEMIAKITDFRSQTGKNEFGWMDHRTKLKSRQSSGRRGRLAFRKSHAPA